MEVILKELMLGNNDIFEVLESIFFHKKPFYNNKDIKVEVIEEGKETNYENNFTSYIFASNVSFFKV